MTHYDASHKVTLNAPNLPLAFECRRSGNYYKTNLDTMRVECWPWDVDEMLRQGCTLPSAPDAPPPPVPTPGPGQVINLGSVVEVNT